MSTVGEQLRSAREALGLPIAQAAETTKIRGDHLRALEAGDYDQFIAPVYIRGFVRTYATLLKLDVPQVMAALDAELSQTQKFREPPALVPTERGPLDHLMYYLSRVNWQKAGLVLGAAAVLVVIAVVVSTLRHRQTTDPLAGLTPALYQTSPTQQLSSEMLPLPTNAPPRR